ncbi:F0F1 ATP synthase subunit delta [Phytomonospora endophytica]|uniref:ATP synthase subunit delta n=1 Tax=Phytomonospora endophytica TaxID=714109 RepID=A0A841F8U1_9ACTN|nr:F-type H+-transporting ATPase subunit delta [Phytomonospora endophytica]GIG68523.1 ATP synthase subunit delta [Phytomonospora endophytica]
MHAASRETYQAGVDALASYAKRVKSDTVRTTADDLLSVAGLLGSEPRLRRALSDPARDGKDRAGLAESLLKGKVSAGALKLATTLTEGRWSNATELLNGTESLGVEALLVAADKDGKLADVEDELFRFGQVVAGDAGLSNALSDGSVPAEQRATLVASLLKDKANPITLRLAEVALSGFGGRGFGTGLSRLVELAAEKREQQLAFVTVAGSLSEDQEQRLTAKLARMYGREVSVKVIVDPAIVGGMSVRVGDDLYDGTVSRRLADARHALSGDH